jgi:hypothetical protein
MLEAMKKSRRIVIMHIMKQCVDGEIDVNEGIRKITSFDREAKVAFEAMMHWQTGCLHYTEEGNVMKDMDRAEVQ